MTNKYAQVLCNNPIFWKNKFRYDNLQLNEPIPTTLKGWVHKYLDTLNNNVPLLVEQYDFTTYPKTLLNFDETFKNLGPIGRGTFAETNLVMDINNNLYALKLFYENNLKEYEDEVNTLIELSTPTCHPDIICYRDHFILNNKYAILTDYIESKTLEQFIRTTSWNLKEVKFIILQLLTILIWMHQKGYRHGDILTGNIIVTKDMKIKLIDLGLTVKINDLMDARGDIFNIIS